MKVKAAVLYEPNSPFVIEEIELEEPKEGEVLVNVKAAGVCHSDWHLVSGATKHPLPVVPGHEGAGTVESVGPGVKKIKPGNMVAFNWAPNCGDSCFYCLNELPSLCSSYKDAIWGGTMLDKSTRFSKSGKEIYQFSSIGCFAEYIVVPEECCVSLNHSVPVEIAALIGCAVSTGIGSVLNTARFKPGSNVVVLGCGGVGLSIIMGAKLAGAEKIIAVDNVPYKLDIAKDVGADILLNSDSELENKIIELTGGKGADYVFEAIGIPSVQENCLNYVRPGGTIVFVGISPMGSNTNLPGAIITRKEISIKGSYYGSINALRDFPLYGDLYLNKKINLDKLISKKYSLEKINEAYDDLLSGKIARGVVVFG
jgi:S-(hydroxymethyl)glutathione dehydrogenase/alcohol dehydrogenase